MPDSTNNVWTPQQDLGDSSSDGAGGGITLHPQGTVATYSPGAQPFSLSLPRENQDKVRLVVVLVHGMLGVVTCFRGLKMKKRRIEWRKNFPP